MIAQVFRRYLSNESGATAIEYGLIASLIAITIIASLMLFGDSVISLFGYVEQTAGDAMDNAGLNS